MDAQTPALSRFLQFDLGMLSDPNLHDLNIAGFAGYGRGDVVRHHVDDAMRAIGSRWIDGEFRISQAN